MRSRRSPTLLPRGHRADHRRRARRRKPRRPQAITRAYNSIYVIDHDGSILSIYDKVHLVPFGEYLPFQDFLERLGLMQLTKVRGGFIPGDRRRAMAVPRAPQLPAAGLLRDHFPGDAVPRAASARAGCSTSPMMAGSASARALSAFPAGARARDRGGPAAGARREYRDFRGGRSARPHRRIAAARHRRRARRTACRGRYRPPLYARAGDGPAVLWSCSR